MTKRIQKTQKKKKIIKRNQRKKSIGKDRSPSRRKDIMTRIKKRRKSIHNHDLNPGLLPNPIIKVRKKKVIIKKDQSPDLIAIIREKNLLIILKKEEEIAHDPLSVIFKEV